MSQHKDIVFTKDIDPIDKIKDILFKSELNKIESYIDSLQDKIKKIDSSNYKDELVVKSLSKAIEANVNEDFDSLAGALSPVVSASLLVQIKNDREEVVNALYPVLGSIIGKFMSASIKELMNSINEKIDQKLSFSSVVRSFQSKVTGVSKAEILFKKGMGTKFQSIYLIHRKTGVLLSEAQSDQFSSNNGDMIAGMFSAISSFVDDWIKKSDEVAMLDSIDYGNSKIIFEKSNSYIVAAVIAGQDTGPLRRSLQKLLSLIHIDFSDHFSKFDGDVSKVPSEIKKNLASILSINEAKKAIHSAKQKKKVIQVSLILACFGFFSWIAFSKFTNFQQKKRLDAIVSKNVLFKKLPVQIDVKSGDVFVKGIVLDENTKIQFRNFLQSHLEKNQFLDLKYLKVLDVKYSSSKSSMIQYRGDE